MKRLILACILTIGAACASAQSTDPDAELRKQVNAFVDGWHDDAAHARLSYFDKMASNGVYIGTDKTELWSREAFKTWAKRFFERKSAWAFTAIRRNVYLSPDKQVIWFDELLDTQMGVCQASGVMHKSGASFEIDHYQLSMAVPNEIAKDVTRAVKEFETKAAPK